MKTISEAWEIARKAWQESEMKKCISKKRCAKCFNSWKEGKGEKPPLFPPDYKGVCPVCGNALSKPTFSF